MKKVLATLIGAALLMASTSALAIPLTGTINFRGDLKLTGPGPITLQTATGIDFDDEPALVGRGATGAFAIVPRNTEVTFKDFEFKPSLSPTPVDPLWTLTYGTSTFSFLMSSVVASYGVNTLTLNGTGIMSGTGYDLTEGTWTLTTQGSGVGDLTFSATSTVPEPGTLVLLGAGFLGLAIYGKRRKNA